MIFYQMATPRKWLASSEKPVAGENAEHPAEENCLASKAKLNR
jgi:hypothetical protein